MSGALCDAVLESGGSAATLESLEHSNLFLVPLDQHRQWYRYHHLFQELLRSQLERAEPDQVPGLLARAADWSEANGQPEEAIGYAQEAEEVERWRVLGAASDPPPAVASRPSSAGSSGWRPRGGGKTRRGCRARRSVAAVVHAPRRRSAGDAAERASPEGPWPTEASRVASGWPCLGRCSVERGGEDARGRPPRGAGHRPRESISAERLRSWPGSPGG